MGGFRGEEESSRDKAGREYVLFRTEVIKEEKLAKEFWGDTLKCEVEGWRFLKKVLTKGAGGDILLYYGKEQTNLTFNPKEE